LPIPVERGNKGWKQRVTYGITLGGEREGDFRDNFNKNWNFFVVEVFMHNQPIHTRSHIYNTFNLHSFVTCTTSLPYDIYSTVGDIKLANDVDASSCLFLCSWGNHLATTTYDTVPISLWM